MFSFRVFLLKNMIRFWRQSKLSSRLIKPFKIIHAIGDDTYELALTPFFSIVHLVFHVSMLHQYIPYESHVLRWDLVQLDDCLTFVEEPIAIFARDVRQLHSRDIHVVKVH